jgi:hypothetical protein
MLRASDRSLASLVDLDNGAVDETPCAFRLTSQVSKDFGPETGIHPATPTAVEGVPPPPRRRKSPPPTSLPQELKGRPGEQGQKKGVVFRLFVFSVLSLDRAGRI